MSRRDTRRRPLGVALAIAVVALGGCAADRHLADPVQATVATTPTTAPAAQPECTAAQAAEDPRRSYDPLASLPAPGKMPAGSTMAAIQRRGRLIAGVSGDTLLFGARNPISGAIEGFDIDMVKAVARAIFGADGDQRIEYRVITYAQRLPKLEAGADHGGVDLVAHTMTINCRRWLRIAFSGEYFTAGQKVLVNRSASFRSIDDLEADPAARVCAPEGSTNIDEIRNADKYPRLNADGGTRIVAKPDITDCLVAMQQGDAEAITGDDTVLAGFAAQDPNTAVVGERFTDEPYGLGIAKNRVDFVRFVNAVLEQLRTSGGWADSYRHWLLDTGALTGTVPAPPVPIYGRSA